MKISVITIFITTFGLAFSRPFPQPPPAPGPPGAQAGNNLPIQWLMNAMPRSGIVGMADNFGAALANFGNGQGSAFDAIFSGMFNGFGNFISGILGSGAVNTAFLNYNNRPPADAGAPPPPPAGGANANGPPAQPEAPPDEGGK